MHPIQQKLSMPQLVSQAAALIFPPRCVHCGRVGSLFCSICWADAVFAPDHAFPTLEHVQAGVAYALHKDAIRDAIHALKYEGLRQMAPIIAKPLVQHIPQAWGINGLIPIPMHSDRLAARGYNQANLLAQALAEFLGCPILSDTLSRNRATPTQVGLNAAERRENVRDAFEVVGEVTSHILLVDDVCTTGATLSEAAAALRKHNVHAVYASTVSLAS